jgi:hypothetical protein
MSKRMGLKLLGTLTLASVCLIGCGQRELHKNDVYSVQGTLLLHGEPAAFVIVHLEPTASNKGVACEGTTREDGTFELRTYSNEDNDGAAPGEYKVILEEYDPVRSGPLPKGSKPTPIPKGNMETGQTVEIKAEPNTLEINVP